MFDDRLPLSANRMLPPEGPTSSGGAPSAGSGRLGADALNRLAARFFSAGYLVVPVLNIERRFDVALAAYDRLIANSERLGRLGLAKVRKSNTTLIDGHGWSWGCDHIYSPELREQTLLDLVSLEPIPDLVRSILGPRVRFSGGHGHWSPVTYDYYLHWHRDTRRERWHLANPDPRSHVQVCLALTDEAVVRVIPGSHLRALEPWEHRFITDEPHGDHPDQTVARIPAGSVLLLNTYTFHRAQCAKETTRRSLHFGFTRVGAEPEPGRVGKVFEWLGDIAFLATQTMFLRSCIEEQLLEQDAIAGRSPA